MLDRTREGLADVHRVTRFLRGRLAFVPRADDIYVVTYPRSGTTWMVYMLHLLVHPGRTEFEHINEVCPWFERSLSIGSHRAEDFEAVPSPRVFKSHLPWGWLPRPGRYVYVVRDGRDVAASYYQFYRRYLGFTGAFDDFFERFLDGQLQYRGWFEHVQGWRAHGGDPDVCVVEYEALERDPAQVLGEVARFLGLRVDTSAIQAAVQGASMEKMKAIEARFDHATALLIERGVQRGAFIGGRGERRAGLDARQEAAFSERASRATGTKQWRLGWFLR